MALALTPRLLRRGLELFAIISLAGVIVVLAVYGENVQAVAGGLLHLHWRWLVGGLGLASMDWIGGGGSVVGGGPAGPPGGPGEGMGTCRGVEARGGERQPVPR